MDKDEVEPLVDQFFQQVQTKNPILDRSSVGRLCEELYEQGLMWNTSTCLVLIICALGALAQPFKFRETSNNWVEEHPHEASNLHLASCYFTEAEKRLGFCLGESSIPSIQCLSLAG